MNSMETKAFDDEADRKFIARMNEFVDLLNRYEPSFPFKYRKFHSYPRYYYSTSMNSMDEDDRKFIARQYEFIDILNRYEPGFPLRYRKYYHYPRYFSSCSDSGSGQQYKMPRNPSTIAGRSPCLAGQCDQRPVGKLSQPASHTGGVAAPAPRAPGSSTNTPSTSQLEGFNTPMYNLGNKSHKTSEYSDNFTSTNKVLQNSKPCNLEKFKNYPKNKQKDFKACGKTKGLSIQK